MAEFNNKWLISFDTDRIKEYIFATNGLKEIRGASAILRKQDDVRKKLLKDKGRRLFNAGGGGAVEVTTEQGPEKIVAEIQAGFLNSTHTATITAVTVSPDGMQNSQAFKERMGEATRKQSLAKREKARLIDIPLEPYFRICEMCGVRAAEKRSSESGSQDLLCSSCYDKNLIGRKVRSDSKYEYSFLKDFRNFAKRNNKDEYWQQHSNLAESLNELGDLSSGYVGFVVMDGNQMGMLLSEIYDEEYLRKYSELLEECVPDLVYETLIEISEKLPSAKLKKLPFEIVLIGGDDIMLFTIADIAMLFCTTLMRKFENELSIELLRAAGLTRAQIEEARAGGMIAESDYNKIKQKPFYVNEHLTFSAGVVLCHANFPIPALVEIGEGLLKNAKKYCAKASRDGRKSYSEGAIDFQVITGSAMDLEQARDIMVHNRPYSLSQLEKLLEFARKFSERDFPSSQLQMLYEACHESSVSGTMMTLRLLARLKNKEHRRLLREFLAAFSQHAVNEPTLWPWARNGKAGSQLRTSITDLIELMNFSKPTIVKQAPTTPLS